MIQVGIACRHIRFGNELARSIVKAYKNYYHSVVVVDCGSEAKSPIQYTFANLRSFPKSAEQSALRAETPPVNG
jgi:hypothetical protein